MKKENKRCIYDVLELLRLRDPAWKHVSMIPNFKVLFMGWRAKELRQKRRSTNFFTDAWRKKNLPLPDWRRFRDYAME